jgi:glycine/D-amino acid oxidase-like deaminating enzyme
VPDPTVAVVGAGALGAATAWQLTRVSDAQVRVLDPDPARGATPRGGGVLTPRVPEPADVGLVQRSLDAYRDLANREQAFEVREAGGVIVEGPEHRERLDRLARVWRAHDVETRAGDADALADLPGCEGLSLDDDERGHVSPADAWADPEAGRQAMIDAARRAGATLVEAPVRAAEPGGPLLADGEAVPAEVTVLAAGVWTPALVEGPWMPPVGAYRAQVCRLEHALEATPGPVVHDVPCGTYWRPAGPGAALVGDGTDLDRHDPDAAPRPDGDLGDRLAARFAARCPPTAPAEPTTARAGFEAGTPDTDPLVGPVPGREDLVLCTGGNGYGFMRAPALGELAAADALGRDPPAPAPHARPDRFEDPPPEFALREGFALDG